MSKKPHSTFFGTLSLIAQPIILNVLSIPATAYIIRGLGASGYGQWTVGTSLVAATAFLTNLGLRTLFVRDIAQNPDQAAVMLAEQLGLRSVLSVVAGGLALLLCKCLHYPPIIVWCVALAAAGLVLSTLVGALNDVLQGLQLLHVLATTSMVSGLAVTVFSVLAIWYGVGPVGLSLAYLTGPAINLLVLLVYARRLFPVRVRWSPPRYLALLRDVRSMGAQVFFSSVQDRIQQLLVPRLVGITPFGYFSAGLIPANRLLVVPGGLMMYFYSAIASQYGENKEAATKQVTRFIVLSLVACMPLALLIAFMAHSVALVLFPKHPSVCQYVIQTTIWSLPIAAVQYPLVCALQASGRHSEAARSQMGATILSSILSFLLVSRLGIPGACWSWLLGNLFSLIFVVPLFARSFPSVLSDIPFGRILMSTAMMALLLVLFKGSHQHPLLVIVEATVSGLAVYISALLLLRVVIASDITRSLAR